MNDSKSENVQSPEINFYESNYKADDQHKIKHIHHIHLNPLLSLKSNDTIIEQINEENSQSQLGRKEEIQYNIKSLVLDLDETLINSSIIPLYNSDAIINVN